MKVMDRYLFYGDRKVLPFIYLGSYIVPLPLGGPIVGHVLHPLLRYTIVPAVFSYYRGPLCVF